MPRLLTIDDDEGLRAALVEMLEFEGYEVDAASDGETGVRLARERRPDLILCDIRMQRLDGYGVLASLRRDPVTATIPVIFLTGMGGPTDVRKGMELGVDDYLLKPFTRSGLVRAVSARLERSKAARQQSLQRLDALRADLAKTLPHEFLTPLTAVMGLASLLAEEGAVAPGDVKEVGAGILAGAQALERALAKFLFFAEIETDTSAGHGGDGVQCDTAVVAESARAEAERAGRAGDLALNVEAGAFPMSGERLRRLVAELVENALNASTRGTPVTVTCGATAEPCLSVADRGAGMTPEQVAGLERAPFLRRYTAQPGLGVGLSIVRCLARRHDATLEFSTVPGEGSTVHFRIPGAPSRNSPT